MLDEGVGGVGNNLLGCSHLHAENVMSLLLRVVPVALAATQEPSALVLLPGMHISPCCER